MNMVTVENIGASAAQEVTISYFEKGSLEIKHVKHVQISVALT